MTTTAPPATARRPATRLPVVLAVAGVLLQVAYPLTDGPAALSVTTVVVLFAACATHAWVHRGARWATGMVVITTGTGLVAEAVGTRTGLPFGAYEYTGSLGWEVLGVPAVVPLAWSMAAYPALLAGQRLARGALRAAAVTAWSLAAWDLFLDPQMVDAGHWRWLDVEVGMPGAPDVPLSNTAGWLVVATVLSVLLQALPRRTADDRVPAALFLWTWASSTLAAAAFFGRPLVALTGGVALGLVAVPYARSLRR